MCQQLFPSAGTSSQQQRDTTTSPAPGEGRGGEGREDSIANTTRETLHFRGFGPFDASAAKIALCLLSAVMNVHSFCHILNVYL